MALRNHDAAMEVVKSTEDIALRQLMARATTAALRRAAESGAPEGEFDMLFFVRTIADLYQQKENLLKVLSGEDLRWWP